MALIVKLGLSPDSVLESVPARFVIAFHRVGVKNQVSMQMSSSNMLAYVLQSWGKFARKYLRKNKVQFKLATGNFFLFTV